MRILRVIITAYIFMSLNCVNSQDLVNETKNRNISYVKTIISSGADVNTLVVDSDGIKKLLSW